MDEYELLRAEMMENYTEINNSCSIFYTAVATILAFAVQTDNYLLCLIPYLVIIPLFFLCESKHNKICWIAAYLYVYLEGDKYNWEKRHHKYDIAYSKSKKGEWQAGLEYYFVSFACSALSIYKIINNDLLPAEKWIRATSVVLFTLVTIIVMKISTVHYVKTRGEMIKKREDIKNGKIKTNNNQPDCQPEEIQHWTMWHKKSRNCSKVV